MKIQYRLFWSVAMTLLFGCVQTEVTVKIKPDGSGRVLQRTFLSQELPTNNGKSPLLDSIQVQRTAERLGKGVRVVSMVECTEKGKKGACVELAFDDIRTLQIGSLANMSGQPADSSARIGFTTSKPSRFWMISPKGTPKAPPPTKDTAVTKNDDMGEQMARMMMMQMFKGLRMVVRLQFEGGIAGTNALYRENDTILLLDMDWDKVMAWSLENPQAGLEQLPSSLEEAKALAAKAPGLRLETADSLWVTLNK